MKLETAKKIFADYYDNEDEITTFVYQDKSYTVLKMTRVTTFVTRYYGGRNAGIGSSRGMRSSQTKTPFWLIFEKDNYLFSGYQYEAVINQNKDILGIIALAFNKMENN